MWHSSTLCYYILAHSRLKAHGEADERNLCKLDIQQPPSYRNSCMRHILQDKIEGDAIYGGTDDKHGDIEVYGQCTNSSKLGTCQIWHDSTSAARRRPMTSQYSSKS
jgi:hypothetical protein